MIVDDINGQLEVTYQTFGFSSTTEKLVVYIDGQSRCNNYYQSLNRLIRFRNC
jgi:hypothetical protein